MNHYKAITEDILARMEIMGTDWKPSWKGNVAIPQNFTTRKHYRGVNVLILWMTAARRGYEYNYWASFKQWKFKSNGHVKKGEHGTTIVFYDRYDRNLNRPGMEADWRSVLRYSYVFNIAQVEGVDLPAPTIAYEGDMQQQAIDEFLDGTGAVIKTGDAFTPCYFPKLDEIRMPKISNYEAGKELDWYTDILHELTHWTGHESRCKREFGKFFGSETYAAEELVAELGATFLGAEFDLPAGMRDDNAKYLNHWKKILRNNDKALPWAAKLAADSTDYLFKRGQYADQADQETETPVTPVGSDHQRDQAESTLGL